jgi:nucleoid-associated protein YgaU
LRLEYFQVPVAAAEVNALALRIEEEIVTAVTDRRQTVSLIGSDKVEGTAVYGAEGRYRSIMRSNLYPPNGRRGCES